MSTTFPQFDAEAFLVRRLKEHGVQVFAGVTDPATRRERFREAIIRAQCDCTVVGKNLAGKTETYAELFARLYGEPLHPNTKRGST